jgi:hypothetical protein
VQGLLTPLILFYLISKSEKERYSYSEEIISAVELAGTLKHIEVCEDVDAKNSG